jgi:arsenate reductase
MSENQIRVLFLCGQNSARSIMAEAVVNRLSGGKLHGVSAGSDPAPHVHPDTIRTLRDNGYETGGLMSKSWDHFAQADMPEVDLVITVCDALAAEQCPIWPGRPAHAHWGLPDPVRVSELQDGDPAPFHETLRILEDRIRRFLAQIDHLDIITADTLERAARHT